MRARKLIIAICVVGIIGAGLYFIRPLVQMAVLVGHGSLAWQALRSSPPDSANTTTLSQARQAFKTTLNLGHLSPGGVEPPATQDLVIVTYASPVGKLPAYLTPDPHDGGKHPAIIWITGGDANSIGDVWSPQPPDDDQSASSFRKAGIVTMYPSLRGGNNNPGHTEGFYGEVDDIVAAADFLAQQPYVDPARIYLGGHSTGGILALLTAESSDRFRAGFAFGARAFGSDSLTYFSDVNLKSMDPHETTLRAPVLWLSSIRNPVFVIEGADGNSVDLQFMRLASKNPRVGFISVPGTDHFSVLQPASRVIAQKILQDTGTTPRISLSAAEIEAARR